MGARHHNANPDISIPRCEVANLLLELPSINKPLSWPHPGISVINGGPAWCERAVQVARCSARVTQPLPIELGYSTHRCVLLQRPGLLVPGMTETLTIFVFFSTLFQLEISLVGDNKFDLSPPENTDPTLRSAKQVVPRRNKHGCTSEANFISH